MPEFATSSSISSPEAPRFHTWTAPFAAVAGAYDERGPLVLPRCRVLGLPAGRGRTNGRLAAGAALALLAAVCVGTASCSAPAPPDRHDPPVPVRLAARTRLPASGTSVVAGPPAVIAEGVAQDLFASAPVIVIAGPARDFTGLQMKGGTIFLMAGAELRTGAWMTRGTIVSLAPIPLLPTFPFACAYNPTFLRLYAKYLQALGYTIPCEALAGAYRRYTGDTSVPGKGEILIWQARAA